MKILFILLVTIKLLSLLHMTKIGLNFGLVKRFVLRLSHTEHGWAHGSNTVYSVIHGMTGTSIELQPCLGMSWYDLDSNVARVYTNKARIYSVKQGLSRLEHDLQNGFSYDCCTVPSTVYGLLRPSTIKHDFYSINWTFTGFTYSPTDFLFELCSNYHTFVYVRFDGLAS